MPIRLVWVSSIGFTHHQSLAVWKWCTHHVPINDKVFGNAHLPVIAWHTSEPSDWAALGWCVDTFLPKCCRRRASKTNTPARLRLAFVPAFVYNVLSSSSSFATRLFFEANVQPCASSWPDGNEVRDWRGEGQDGGIEDTEGKTMRKLEGGWG